MRIRSSTAWSSTPHGELLARHSQTNFVNRRRSTTTTRAPGPPAHVDLGAHPKWNNNSAGDTRLKGANAHAYADLATNGVNAGEDIAAVGGDWNFAQVRRLQRAAPGLDLHVDLHLERQPRRNGPTNRSQTTTQLFYSVNNFHDWLKAAPIGFNAASHNFEGGDPVVNAEADDFGGTNNANMYTPADGDLAANADVPLPGRRRVPEAVNSGDDAGVVYHEYTHGLSNRLVNNGLGNSAARQAVTRHGRGLERLLRNGLPRREGLRARHGGRR